MQYDRRLVKDCNELEDISSDADSDIGFMLILLALFVVLYFIL